MLLYGDDPNPANFFFIRKFCCAFRIGSVVQHFIGPAMHCHNVAPLVGKLLRIGVILGIFQSFDALITCAYLF